MVFRTWPVAALALGALLVLVVVSVLESSRRAQDIYAGLDQLNQRYQDVETKMRRLRTDVNLSGIFVRDYLLDPLPERATEYRARLAEFRRSNLESYEQLYLALHGTSVTDARLESLRAKLEEYWGVLGPLFSWNPAQKQSRASAFLREEVIPRREAALAFAQEIEQLNRAALAAQRTEVSERHAALRSDLYRLLWWSLLLGVIVAFPAILRLRQLERRSAEERAGAEQAEQRMRQLSQQIVATQEEERRHLSRELHDHVGQVLTALRMELGSIDRLRARDDAALARAVGEARELVDNMVRTVRDLALGLRPSMLDDFGLQPALEWHVRDFTRRYGLRVDLAVEGDLTVLSDRQRTCVYRVVQEALTNCVRHASAATIRVMLKRLDEGLVVAVVDDGIGMLDTGRHNGLGLRGIEERVRDLGGTFDIHSAPGVGTSLTVRLPLTRTIPQGEVGVASVIG